MKTNHFYSTLDYDGFLKNNSEIASSYPDYREIEQLGADKVYFSGNNPAVLFVEVAAFNDVALRRIAGIQHNAWNYRKILLLFAVSDTEIRIYNCQEKPNYISKTDNASEKLNKIQIFDYNKKSDEQALSVLSDVFSRIGVDCGLLWTTDYDVRKKVNIQCRLDKYLVQSLIKTANALEKDIKDKDIIHGLLMRSLFILFLQDKGAAREAGLYEKIKKGANSYFDILEDIDATYKLFNEVQVHFNGNVFPVLPDERKKVKPKHLKLIRDCFTDGDISGQPKLFNDWKLFNFKIIQIELLSEIYENFLGELKREKGQFYTPYSLVELILKDKLPTNATTYNVKILDPACGSGIFLVESYKRLIKRWKNANPTKKISFGKLKTLLLDNIYGIEIDSTAIKVAAFSLYLALVDQLDPKSLWIESRYQLPYLIYDPDDKNIEQGKNLWRRDTIGEVDAQEFVKVDLVVGNPPFGTEKLISSIKNYLVSKKYPQQMVLAFMDKAVEFAPNGQIALLFNTKSLTNTNKKYQNFRKWLLQKNHVEKIYNLSIFRNVKKDFGGWLFEKATVPISIVYFQKNNPDIIPDTIEYCAPKTYIKFNLIEGIILDSSDIKFLPRIECQKPDTKIWKIAMWGGIQDFQLIKKIFKGRLSLKKHFNKNKDLWFYKTGLNADSEHLDFIPEKIIKTQRIKRYYTTEEDAVYKNDKLYRRIMEDVYHPPFVIIKQAQSEREIAASYIDYFAYGLSSTYVINGNSDNNLKKTLTCYINSKIAKYYLFLSTSSWGIERERASFEEILELPYVLNEIEEKTLNNVSAYFNTIKKEHTKNSNIEQSINKTFIQIFKLTEKEIICIEDALKYNLDIFEKGEESIAFHRTLQSENKAYAKTLCSELNTFLSHSKLRVRASIYDVQLRDPLNMVVLHFGDKEQAIEIKDLKNLRENLKNIDRYMLQQKSDSIYVQKQLRYSDFNNDTVYLIKPNQKRFWTRSQAIDDATSLITEIINMEGK